MTKPEPACTNSPTNANLEIEKISFEVVPSQSKLFLDFQRDATALKRFYPNAVKQHYDIYPNAAPMLENYQAERARVCDALERLNKTYDAGAETFKNILRLRSASCVAVVTGQQAGLFTGPLYTIYKALSAVKLAECLTGRGQPAVPVFWIATEDHDWQEVKAAEVIGCDGRLASVELKNDLHREAAPVGGVALDESIEEAIARLLAVLPTTEFTPQVAALIRDAYKENINYGIAFARFMSKLTARFGIIMLDPLDAELKKLAAPIYTEAARRASDIAHALVERSKQLEAENYHAQVLVTEDSFPLFVHTDNGDDLTDEVSNGETSNDPHSFARRAITRTPDGRYAIKGIAEANAARQARTSEEWGRLIEQQPARFSPNVTLRAVVQDYLLPTVAYFGGAAEIAYFAQTSEVYRLLNRPATPIIHRASLSVIERRTARTLERYDLRLPDFFAGLDAVIERVVREHLGIEGTRAFDSVESDLTRNLELLRAQLNRVDPTLDDALTNSEAKIKYQLDALRTRFARAQMQRERAAHRQLERAAIALYPDNALQERHINITSLLARHGLYCIDWMYDAIDLGASEHLVVYL